MSKIDNLIAAQNLLSSSEFNLHFVNELNGLKLNNKSSQHPKQIANQEQINDRSIASTSNSYHSQTHNLQMTNLNSHYLDNSFNRLTTATEHENHPPNQCVNLTCLNSSSMSDHHHAQSNLSNLMSRDGNLIENCNCQQLDTLGQHVNCEQRCLKRRKKKKSRLATNGPTDECNLKKLELRNLPSAGNEQMNEQLHDNLNEQKSPLNHLVSATAIRARCTNAKLNASKLIGSNSLAFDQRSTNYNHQTNEDVIKSEQAHKLTSYNNDHHYHLKFDSSSKQQKIDLYLKKKNQTKSKSSNVERQAKKPKITNPSMAGSGFGTSLRSLTTDAAANILDTLNLNITSPSKQIVVASWIKNLSPNSLSSVESNCYDCFDEDQLNLDGQLRKPRKHLDSCQTNSTNLTAITDQILNSDECIDDSEDELDELIDDEELEDEDDELVDLATDKRYLSYDIQRKRYIKNVTVDLGRCCSMFLLVYCLA